MAGAKKPRRGARKKAASKKPAAKAARSKASAVEPTYANWYSEPCTVGSYHPTFTQVGGLDLPNDDDDEFAAGFIAGAICVMAIIALAAVLMWLVS
jgi:hypothetical protein